MTEQDGYTVRIIVRGNHSQKETTMMVDGFDLRSACLGWVTEVPPNMVTLPRVVVDKIQKYLNEDIAMLDCTSRVRTMNEDTWSHGMFLRDELETALKEQE